MAAVYNENDPFAAAWLRSLIERGLLPAGDVDTRSIADVQPDDYRGYAHVHLFAGIGGWPLALRRAGWLDDREVWTGSCPCQPFSGAGKQRGEQDERHLWPEFRRLVEERHPATIFGEQVASKLGREWLAGVRADLEELGYAVGATDLCAASAGAPHIRQRLWWVADNYGGRQPRFEDAGLQRAPVHDVDGCGEFERVADADGGISGNGGLQSGRQYGQQQEDGRFGGLADDGASRQGALQRSSGAYGRPEIESDRYGDAGGLADCDGGRQPQLTQRDGGPIGGLGTSRGDDAGGCGDVGGLEHAARDGWQQRRPEPGEWSAGCGHGEDVERLVDAEHGRREGRHSERRRSGAALSSSPHGAWSRYDIVHCTDGKARRFEPGSFPLAHGVSARVGRLRGYGNAINPELAAIFIKACEEARRG